MRKAQDLERAFREKYDPSGMATERRGTLSFEQLAAMQGGGLFSPKRFVRCSGLVAGWKKADWEKAAQLFSRTPEDTIVVTVEEELSEQDEQAVRLWPKSGSYRFPLLRGPSFMRLCEDLAKQQALSWSETLRSFAERVEGDTWTFWNALPQWKATTSLPDVLAGDVSPFARAEQYLKQAKAADALQDADGALQGIFLQQARQALRVIANEPDARMPTFAQRKWQRLPAAEETRLAERCAMLLGALITTRRGIASEAEEAILLLR